MQITGRWQDSQDAASITVAAPGAGRKNVLHSVTITNSANANVLVQSPSGTTIWRSKTFGSGGFAKDWDSDSGVFGAENAALIISVSAGTYQISASGVIVG